MKRFSDYSNIIGIDPDLHKSGVAIYEPKGKKLIECTSMYMWDLFDTILVQSQFKTLFRLEFPNTTNTWHKGGKGASLNVGKNQAVAIIIKEFLDAHRCNYELLSPTGYSILFNDENVFKNTTGFKKKTNKDARAAAAMIWFRAFNQIVKL